MEGTVLIIWKALYGLKASGAMWHRKFASNLKEMGFSPCEADHYFWMKEKKDHYEFIAVIVDDLLVFSRNAMEIIEKIKKDYKYKLKGVGTPEYYNGGDVSFTKEGLAMLSAKTYITNVWDKVEKLMEVKLKNWGCPMAV